MAHNGDIFTKPSREILFYALILSHRGNRFIRLLYSWACELIDDKTFNLENHVTLARFFHGDRNQWMNRIKHVRREALERLEKYAENMLRYTMDNGQVETAMHWNDVICRVRQLKGFRPMVSNRGEMSRLVKELVDGFNAAGRRTYVICRSQAETPLQIECQPTVAKGGKKGETPQEIKELGRFKVEIYEKHYLIRDTIQNKKYKINRTTNAGSYTRELVLNYATGTDQTHASDDSWKGAFQSGRGDATKFKRDQIFILPRWNAEKGRFMPTQSSNRWRLWTDEELKLSKQERLQKFIDEHPNGLPN